ncbi:MAG: type II toxin-antitoxin system RelE/ParE family toxin [Fibrobacter sp.]|nr:type II toxin-antitoxin system RelE/ParE family toxin [Fibrobacter sp.]MBR3072970.1 type II toxin-antitoxin system RelE/ParE family toxin [Fibrobacter sp.]
MKFAVEKISSVVAEINALEKEQQDVLKRDYEIIEKQGIEYVRVRPLQKEIFEIKSNELRSLFKYKAGAIIVIGVVFVKRLKRLPKTKSNSPYND